MTNEEILKNINNYTFQYALNEIGTGFVQFFQMDFESILQGNNPRYLKKLKRYTRKLLNKIYKESYRKGDGKNRYKFNCS